MEVKTRCRAKVRSECPRHGKRGLGIAAERLIQGYLVEGKRHPIPKGRRQALPLKELNPAALAVTVNEWAAENLTDTESQEVTAAILLAAQLHRKDFRANRGKYPYTAYIEHPLRNALRVIRFGCEDKATIIGCLLHDTVEDHPFAFAKLAGVNTRDEALARQVAYTYITDHYGIATAKVVEGMSNPLSVASADTQAEKNALYSEHVVEAINLSPRVAVCKIADLLDNGGSLHHTLTGMSPESIRKRAVKYHTVWPAIIAYLSDPRNVRALPITSHGARDLLTQVRRAGERIVMFATEPLAPVSV